MNIRQIKLALTVGLINSNAQHNAIQVVKELMAGFKEVGSFLGLTVVTKSPLNQNHIKKTYALQFENCRLDLDLVSNPLTKNQYVQGFQLK
jgi:hypothetical protein